MDVMTQPGAPFMCGCCCCGVGPHTRAHSDSFTPTPDNSAPGAGLWQPTVTAQSPPPQLSLRASWCAPHAPHTATASAQPTRNTARCCSVHPPVSSSVLVPMPCTPWPMSGLCSSMWTSTWLCCVGVDQGTWTHATYRDRQAGRQTCQHLATTVAARCAARPNHTPQFCRWVQRAGASDRPAMSHTHTHLAGVCVEAHVLAGEADALASLRG
jgi:hypothetical protein